MMALTFYWQKIYIHYSSINTIPLHASFQPLSHLLNIWILGVGLCAYLFRCECVCVCVCNVCRGFNLESDISHQHQWQVSWAYVMDTHTHTHCMRTRVSKLANEEEKQKQLTKIYWKKGPTYNHFLNPFISKLRVNCIIILREKRLFFRNNRLIYLVISRKQTADFWKKWDNLSRETWWDELLIFIVMFSPVIWYEGVKIVLLWGARFQAGTLVE